MPRQYRYFVPALTFCTMLGIPGIARAATTITPDAPPTAAEIAAARRALPGDFRDAEAMSHHALTFTVGRADLNGDGRPDLIIHYTDQGWCGSHGCLAYALLASPSGYSSHAITLVYFVDRDDPQFHASWYARPALRRFDGRVSLDWNRLSRIRRVDRVMRSGV